MGDSRLKNTTTKSTGHPQLILFTHLAAYCMPDHWEGDFPEDTGLIHCPTQPKGRSSHRTMAVSSRKVKCRLALPFGIEPWQQGAQFLEVCNHLLIETVLHGQSHVGKT